MVVCMANKVTVEEIEAIVKDIESEDPIDWGMLSIDEYNATSLIINQMVEQYNNNWINLPDDDKIKILLASMSKLIIENFVLNVKLRQ
ncbi:MAG: hypothetical protein RL348_958 [Bacteroidota bacterium]|jgi:hypothetical protein